MASAGQSYKLDLNTDKRNVFVTQLHDREDEDDIVTFPVVKESGDKLIETGLNTLQRTLLLKKEAEVSHVDAELETKRHEFNQRMEACAQRQIEVQKKQQRMKDMVSKFEKFIQENEAKRRRAIQKYQQEVKLCEQKSSEFEQLTEQLEELKARHTHLSKKLQKYKKYEDYLIQVIDAMPEDYLPSSEDKVKGLMMRHRTLSESNQVLITNVVSMADELEDLKQELENLKQEHAKEKVSDSSTLARLQGQQEQIAEVNQKTEAKLSSNAGLMRKRRTDLGMIFMAIDNIYEKCRKAGLSRPDDHTTWVQKLYTVRDYLNDRKDVAHMAMYAPHSGSITNSAKGQRKLQPLNVAASKT